jgi:hypothetical protein
MHWECSIIFLQMALCMNVAVKLFCIVAIAVPLPGQARPAAKPEPGHKNVVATIPNTDDIEFVIRKLLAAGPGEKAEFETTAQFQARQQALQSDRSYAFAPHACDFEYDADSEIMTASIYTENYQFSSYDKLISFPVKTVDRRVETHTGTNAFGAKAVYTSRLSDDYGVVVSQEVFRWLRSFFGKSPDPFPGVSTVEYEEIMKDFPALTPPSFSFPLEPTRARVMKPSLRVVLVGTIPDVRVHLGDYFSAATISKPTEWSVNRFYVSLAINEVRIVDARTGRIIVNWRKV